MIIGSRCFIGNPITNYHNVRYSKVTFDLAENGILHGFAGYFDCVLYKDIEMSIHPERHSTGMFSWFPIFFPLKVSYNQLEDLMRMTLI